MLKKIQRMSICVFFCLILLIPVILRAESGSRWGIKYSPSLNVPIVDGDSQRFRRNLQISDNVSGGIEEFSLGKESNGTKVDVDGRLLSDRDFGINLNFLETNNAYFNIKADTFRYYFDSSNLYYAKIPGGSTLNNYEIDDKVYADRGVYGFDAGMTLLDKHKVSLGYEHKVWEGKTNRYTGGWIREFPGNSWITWEYPLSQEVNQYSDKIFSGIDTNIIGYNVSSKVEWEKFSGRTEHMEPGYYQNGTLVFQRFYKSSPDYSNWNFTEKADRYFLEDKLLLNLGYQYQLTNTTSDYDVDSFDANGARHYAEHSLNFIETAHSGKSGTHIFDFILSAFPTKEYKPWVALKYKNGRAHSDSIRGEEGAEAGVADNNPNTVDERWFFESLNKEQSLTESTGIDITSIPKTSLSFSADFEQKKTRYDWDANIVEVFAGTDDGDWRWKADVKDFHNSYKLAARSKPVDWLTVSTKYRFKMDISELNNIIRNIEAKPGDPEFDATVPTNYYYPGRIGDWQRPSHRWDIKFSAKVNPRLTLNPYYEYYTETMKVSSDPVKEISDYDSNTFGLGFNFQPKDNLSVTFDISNRFASTHSRSADFSNSIDATYFGGTTEDFNNSALSTSGNIFYQLGKYAWNLNSGYVKGKGLFDTAFLNTGLGLNYSLKEGATLNAAYNFYNYHEEDNGGINDYNAHLISAGLKLIF